MSSPPRPASPPEAPPLTIVIVNYNGWDDVRRLIGELHASAEIAQGRCEVVVVDNASDAPPPDELREHPGVRLILRADNGGFAAGVNAGWKAARSPWLLLLNFDLVAGPGMVGQVLGLLDRFDSRPEGPPGIVGLGLRNPDGTPQPSVGIFPSLARSVWEPLIPRSRRKYQPTWRAKAGPVPWVTGAALLVRAELLGALGGMDEDFFLYYEEVALCRAAWDRGWSVEFDPSVEVVHLHPLQTRRLTPRMRVITRHSKLLYFHKHLPRWQFRGLAGIVAAEAAVRGLWSRIRRDREARRSWKAIGRMILAWSRSGRPPLRGPSVRILADTVARPKAPRREPVGKDDPR